MGSSTIGQPKPAETTAALSVEQLIRAAARRALVVVHKEARGRTEEMQLESVGVVVGWPAEEHHVIGI
jgi:hypothetical protein